MDNLAPFSFSRSKGIVWVCDLVKSSNYLNSIESANDIESFIPRLYFVSKIIVESYGGVFIKWTGDGFLAFFEFTLDREKEVIAKRVYEAAFHLSIMTNITQLGLKPTNEFKIRHGITYEKDALLMTLKESQSSSFDIIGKAVVLAFRLSGIDSDFPSIVTIKELFPGSNARLIKWAASKEDILVHFKGEKFGTQSVILSVKGKNNSAQSFIRLAKKSIKRIDSPENPVNEYVLSFTTRMSNGPEWCSEIINLQVDFLKNELYDGMRQVITLYDNAKKAHKNAD